MSSETENWSYEVQNKIVQKMNKVIRRNLNKIPYQPIDGRYSRDHSNEISNWTNGFWGGILWQMYIWTKDFLYQEEAEKLEKKQDAIFLRSDGFDHDSGFKWLPTAVVDYKLFGGKDALNRGMLAADNLAGRFNLAGNFIRAWNDREDGVDTRGWAIIDCLMNLPLLYWASEESQDPRFCQIAKKHADMVRTAFVRSDGSVNHIVEFDPFTGEKISTHGGQGMADGSSWTRGQAWGIYGFALSYKHTNDEKYLKTAQKIADYFISKIPENCHIPVDFCQPQEVDYEDDTAAAIAACGFLEIASCVTGNEAEKYRNWAIRLLKILTEEDADWNEENDPLLLKGTGSYDDPIHNYPILYGDFYYMLAIAKLNKQAIPIW
ncbi:glycoside hydrolase family 88 protein [Enterococcus sp. JM9B]|uniref:glycoside hydrolase family 88 protein n=1 Tax=Enterococcus sp. JM9B TaxID=1857216 RepID=UPI001374F7C0|nr:glycoside hydrolase family 88 protein [Enterococcus sp. JM9B]KAF1303135.1 glycosyl hydrolase family 88 [Enterococcus sp. JM9B]